MNRNVYIVLGLILLFFTNGCTTLIDFENSQEFRSNAVAIITPEQNIGQVFISRRPHFNQLQIWLKVSEMPKTGGILRAKIKKEPFDQNSLVDLNIPLSILKNQFPLTLKFNSIKNSQQQNFYLSLEIDQGVITAFGRNEDQYPFGELWINQQPKISDLAFRTGYQYNFTSFCNDLQIFITNFLIIVPLLLVLWLPGRLFLELLQYSGNFDWGERTALSIGISLAIIPVIMTWTSELKISWNSYTILIIEILLLFALFARKLWKKPGIKVNQIIFNIRTLFHSIKIPRSTNLILLLIFIFTLAHRLIMVRDLSAPAWVDSIHHALITKLITERGTFPDTYEPYINLETANYHSGFHATSAVFLWLSRLDILKGLLIYGQILNALMVFPVYLFTLTFTKNRIAGLFAALATGFFLPMPTYLTSWGRFTHLAGLAILPTAYVITLHFWKNQISLKNFFKIILKNPFHLIGFFLTAFIPAGLLLTHYRIFVFYLVLLFFSTLIFNIKFNAKKKFIWQFLQATIKIILTLVLSIFFILPWFIDALNSLIIPSFSWNNPPRHLFYDFSWSFITASKGIYVFILSILGFLWAIIQKKRFPWIMLFWCITLFFLANLSSLKIPGGNFINNTSVAISLFMPISLGFGFLFSWFITGWEKVIKPKFRLIFSTSLYSLFALFSFLASSSLLTIINPSTILFRQVDKVALDWININIQDHEVIAINPFSWGYGLYAGSDGGYWISPYAGNPTLPPPVLYGLEPTSMEISEFEKQIIQNSSNINLIAELFREKGIHYVFIGSKGGIFSPSAFERNPNFIVIYHNLCTWIFEITPLEEMNDP